MINLQNKIVWVTGPNRVIGKTLCQQLTNMGAIVCPITHEDYDLTETNSFKFEHKPDYVFHLAGYNGGIELNRKEPASIFGLTLKMAMNVFEWCVFNNVKKIVTPLTSCGYPPFDAPLTEDLYLLGEPHDSVRGHGYCRRSMLIYGQLLNKQRGNRFVFPILNNNYGPFSRYDEPDRLKVCDSLISKFIDAEYHNEPSITLWGTGSARRELIYGSDSASGLIKVMESYEDYENPINLGFGTDHSIKQMSEVIKRKSNYKGEIKWDINKPEGAKSKLLDVSKMKKELDWQPITELEEGVEKTIKWYKNLRGY